MVDHRMQRGQWEGAFWNSGVTVQVNIIERRKGESMEERRDVGRREGCGHVYSVAIKTVVSKPTAKDVANNMM